ncbi:hypothetical protein HFN60_25010 [Rhizobium leguminosarum]|uniref:macro domain-containing protein n=1 Tax=Rhizobium leguminosarum TaxID=384 RepID=UPI001C94ECB0|nr:macro domain-containing protein [Rhizobium leguminosarum]MBY5818868.1 hypothetical protein [Rhizobium leguminosarum]
MGLIHIVSADITSVDADVVVNSANPPLGGIGPELPDGVGGVDGAIHRAAGIELWRHLQTFPILGEIEKGWPARCWPGSCVTTPGFRMKARYIVHGVAPVFDETRANHCFDVLRELYRAIFREIEGMPAIRLIAAPPIGTRWYRFPTEEASRIAMSEAQAFVSSHTSDIVFCVVDPVERALYRTRVPSNQAG